ncbi:MAG: hypothetical protein SFT81_07985 [Candidatus Caenarcaniphilales bacterium]|nr:hypothetical protein [Candidatus Caenarcaniphilales bacterium]
MSSIPNNFPSANTSSAAGIQMGNMGEGGGTNFYMGGDESQQEGYQEETYQNPDLVLIDQGKENERNQNRQFLENLITGGDNNWFNPWEAPPTARPPEAIRRERQQVREYGAGRQMQNQNRKRYFIINA